VQEYILVFVVMGFYVLLNICQELLKENQYPTMLQYRKFVFYNLHQYCVFYETTKVYPNFIHVLNASQYFCLFNKPRIFNEMKAKLEKRLSEANAQKPTLNNNYDPEKEGKRK
jgi:hypothetical protein